MLKTRIIPCLDVKDGRIVTHCGAEFDGSSSGWMLRNERIDPATAAGVLNA